MAWLSLSIQTDCQHAEKLADLLLEAGALAASIEDADAGTAEERPQYGEPGSISTPGWQRSRVSALLPAEADARELLGTCARLAGLEALPAYAEEEIAEQDWVRLTQSQFEPIRISSRLWIVPSWHEAPDPEATVLVLDPGMAFGTGSHPTTRLCLEWLDRHLVPGASVLDYGCGSGILAIAAARLGAGRVLGVDIDAQALTAAKHNADLNAAVVSIQDSAEAVRGQFDVVLANILANPLKVLAPALCGHLRCAGQLVLSGILVEQAEGLVAAYAPYLRLEVAGTREGWVCLTGVKG
ncbi:50S ribosomal protein L11 methyltransferase [Accumulibacter sp.]|uniref:50S ribosomal protein L11 methyltransferase n=1 Tax=Accumulibacter sp. TaxID=2053492 RepID=UPI0025F84321|nr:50S ribosomal protein L11 methyltransferase [Accumulibacter sp.]MCM8593956.1 50S ribosomal protein L11 methyltransferase [Accumulibacter sp.]MCM8627805.1 50S ribosomal protein L11 methyltransferase [Accumulibacter sp.]MDS4048097.1 50S ribosomal protein L11 methyltransferase [Accumulibacter sp.]